MRTVGSFEAKTHFSQLLAEVIKGHSIAITKHGQQVALLIPTFNESERDATETAINTLRALRKKVRLGTKLSIRILKEMGRK